MSSVVLCAHCHKEVPAKPSKYCSASCRRIETNRAWEARQMAQGNCRICGKPRATKSRNFCARHRERHNELNRQSKRRRATGQ